MKILDKIITFGILIPIYFATIALFAICTLFLGVMAFDDEISCGFRKLME